MDYYIYALTDLSGNPFYIGKSNNPEKRKKRHIYDAKTLGYNYPVHNKIRKLLREGLGLEFQIIESGLSELNIDEREQYWIADYRQRGIKIYNVAAGGEGGKGANAESIEKVRQANLGKKRNEETKKRMSEARKGIKFSDEHKKNLSKARKKRITTDETRQKMSDTSKGKINIKIYELIDPNGQKYTTTNGLSDFCRINNLTAANLIKVIKGERTNHKGWTINYANH